MDVDPLDPLGDVGGVVADALEVVGDLERHRDHPQVDRHRLARGEQPDRQLVDLLLELVDLAVVAR